MTIRCPSRTSAFRNASSACIDPVADGRGLLEAHASRLVRQRGALAEADELRVRPEPTGAEDVVTDAELADGCAHRFDLARQLDAQRAPLRPPKAADEAPEERMGRTNVGVRLGDRRGVDPDQDLVVPGDRSFDLLDSEDLRRTVAVLDDGFHARTVRTTFPVFCPVSTYLVASTTCSNG